MRVALIENPGQIKNDSFYFHAECELNSNQIYKCILLFSTCHFPEASNENRLHAQVTGKRLVMPAKYTAKFTTELHCI